MARPQTVLDPPTEETALTAPARNAVAALAVAEGADRTDMRGKEGIDSADLILPRVAIAQKTSPEIEEEKVDRYIAGLQKYQLFNTVTKENYGNGPLEFVVLQSRKRAMQFDAENRVVDFEVPLDDDRLEFTNGEGGKRTRPVATLFHEFVVMLCGSQQLAVISFKGTQLRVATDLATYVSFRPGASWLGKYTLRSGSKQFGAFTAGQYVLVPSGATSPEDVKVAEAYYNSVKGKKIQADATGIADDDAKDSSVPF